MALRWVAERSLSDARERPRSESPASGGDATYWLKSLVLWCDDHTRPNPSDTGVTTDGTISWPWPFRVRSRPLGKSSA